MKVLTFLAMIFMATVSPAVEPQSWEELSSHIFTNAAIVWQAKTDALPKSFWTYKIIRPHAFSQTTISNAMVIAELPPKGIPKSPTNHMCIQDDCHCSCAIHCIFSTDPSDASIYFTSQLRTDSTQQIPADTNIVRWAWGYAHQLGLDWAQLQEKCMTSHFNSDTNGNPLTNQISGRGVYLSRLLDGIKFGSDGPDSTSCEGFWMEFGSHEIMNGYSLTWHDLQRDRQIPTASAAQIIQCIQAHKAFVLPEPKGGEDYFQTLKTLAYAKKLTITQLTPYYSEGVFAEVSKNGMPEAFMTPYAELQGAVDFGTSNTVVRIVAPIIASDIHRLLRK